MDVFWRTALWAFVEQDDMFQCMFYAPFIPEGLLTGGHMVMFFRLLGKQHIRVFL